MRSYGIKHVTILAVLALASLALAMPAASQAVGSPTEAAAPTVKTGGARVSGTTVVLEGTVNPHTLATTYYFRYGPTVVYEHETTHATLKGGPNEIDPEKVSATAPGIQPGWHYVLVATNEKAKNAEGQPTNVEGHDRVFTLKTKTNTKGKKLAFVLAKTFPPTTLGSVFILDGALTGTGDANRAIQLESTPYPYRAAYADVGAPILTGPTGAFSFHVAGLTSSTKFRIATVSAPRLISDVVPALVSVRVVLKARAAGPKGFVRLYGTVTPAEAGAHVYFQLERLPKAKGEKPVLEKPGKLEKPGQVEKSEKEKAPTFLTKFNTVVKRATKTVSRLASW